MQGELVTSPKTRLSRFIPDNFAQYSIDARLINRLWNMKVTIFCLIFLQIEAEFDNNTLDVTRAVAIFAKNRERDLIGRRQEMKFNSK